MTRWLNNVASLAEAYDGFVVDQFGVLHDGHQAYPGAADALLALRRRGRRVIVLSNSGKRAEPNAARLAALGIPPQAYDELLSSGELSWLMLQRRDRRPWSTLGHRVLLINPANDAALRPGAVGRQALPDDLRTLSGADAGLGRTAPAGRRRLAGA